MTPAAVVVQAYAPADREEFHELLRGASLAEYGPMLESGELDDPLAHPVVHPGAVWLARDAGRVVGFGMLLVFPSAHEPWALVRLGVRSSHRRRGIGTALLRSAEAALAAIPADRTPALLTAAAWLPADDAASFLEHRGFSHWRFWWLMERAPGDVPAPAWPPGVRLATFEPTDQVFAEWTACFNESFATRFPSHLATEDEARGIAAGPRFRPDGLLLAWRGERCVGFCRDTLLPGGGEVDVLAVRPEARGTGLGRALLRWGVDWLTREGVPSARLLVDGENSAALRLYRSEGFDVARTRRMWARRAIRGPGDATGSAPPSASR